ncbi:hypothetical protein O7626_00490 [Micromonospora sp. WMMD1102]|uniref:hypothetical protein n=1 Tax=Micromonospora sp. WMMD1102 TaxID=3016105 RepID=UPI0024152A61|nr:hypothetical protein [Micromonospora sp. WMMD1102]MDG4784351.1 hypothetical protein [Micromonospora sp. WMMD1102]MDG4784424.1 hypothetical protein [Micromonospora sp. WMMD1102]
MEIRKMAVVLPVSAEVAADTFDAGRAFARYLNATPEQRAEWERQAADQRRAEREAATPVALTLDVLLDKLGWSREYAEHVVQPYCRCEDTRDGWERCQHADDLGLDR